MNTWTISVQQIGPITPWTGRRTYDDELDSITSVLSDICESLSEEGSVRFLAGGFGQDAWPVDVGTDLTVVIEQIPAVLHAIREGTPTILGFYEQGIQRVLSLESNGAEITVQCQSMTSWQPDPSTIRFETGEVLRMLDAVLSDFVDCAGQRCPDLVLHPWFRAWAGGCGWSMYTSTLMPKRV